MLLCCGVISTQMLIIENKIVNSKIIINVSMVGLFVFCSDLAFAGEEKRHLSALSTRQILHTYYCALLRNTFYFVSIKEMIKISFISDRPLCTIYMYIDGLLTINKL